jgi:hypothetical protein
MVQQETAHLLDLALLLHPSAAAAAAAVHVADLHYLRQRVIQQALPVQLPRVLLLLLRYLRL